MPDYEKLYLSLFNGVTDTIEQLRKLQQTAEELYVSEASSNEQCESDEK